MQNMSLLSQEKEGTPCSVYNGMSFPPIPKELEGLHDTEWRLLSPRFAFMKVFQAPIGGQKKIKGNVVNVPTDVITTFILLPRMSNDEETIRVKIWNIITTFSVKILDLTKYDRLIKH